MLLKSAPFEALPDDGAEDWLGINEGRPLGSEDTPGVGTDDALPALAVPDELVYWENPLCIHRPRSRPAFVLIVRDSFALLASDTSR